MSYIQQVASHQYPILQGVHPIRWPSSVHTREGVFPIFDTPFRTVKLPFPSSFSQESHTFARSNSKRALEPLVLINKHPVVDACQCAYILHSSSLTWDSPECAPTLVDSVHLHGTCQIKFSTVPALTPFVRGIDSGSGVGQERTHVWSLSLASAKSLTYLYSKST